MAMSEPASRMPLVDAIKAVGCLAIVAHHLAFYGPMSDFAYPLSHAVFDSLYAYGRMAVQAFLVVAGFLCAMHLGQAGGAPAARPWPAIRRRYVRLIVPLLAALTFAIISSAIARRWMTHESISAVPNAWQLLAHIFLLQDVVDQEALSAGVWYIAIDFQLFACMALLFWMGGVLQQRDAGLRHVAVIAVAGLTAGSLVLFNRDDQWDETALFYFAYYGLGALVYWGADRNHRRRSLLALAGLAVLVGLSLLIDFRMRVVVAAAVALLLGAARYTGYLHSFAAPPLLNYLGRISYSIFLVHFPICLLVNAAFFHFLPHDPVTSVVGLVLAWLVSVAAGALFYRWIEGRRMGNPERWLVVAVFLATGLIAAWARL